MFKRMTKLMVLAMLLCIIAVNMNAKVPRKVVMEDHTGAWCGWCVLGNQAMEDMLSLYGDKFIPVAMHNGDKMAVGNANTIEATTFSAFGLTGYPYGTMNRMKVLSNGSTAYPVHPSFWEQVVATHISDQSDVNVTITNLVVDKTAKTLSVTVNAKMEADYAGQLAFNLYIMEDNQTGTGSGWDQTNYLAGRAGYETHPYYKLTNPVKNFLHQNVLIDCLGGSWGDATGFDNPAVSGKTYTRTFTADLSGYPIQDYSNLWFVGLVQETGAKYEILNAMAINKKMPKPKAALSTQKSLYYISGTREQSKSQDFTFTNDNKWDVDVEFSADPAGSDMPSGWQVTFSKTTAKVKAGESVTVTANVKLDKTVAYGVAAFKVKVLPGTDYDGTSTSGSLAILTDGVDNVFYSIDETGIIPIKASLKNNPTYSVNSAVVPLTPETYAAYPRDNFKLALFPETYTSRGTLAIGSNDNFIAIANEFIDAGKPIYISSIDDLFFIAGNYTTKPTQATIDLFRTKLKITGYTQGSPFQSGDPQAGTVFAVNVVGVTGDDVSEDMDFMINQYTQAHPYYTFLLDQVNPVDSKSVTPFLTYANTTMTKGTENAAVKIMTGKGKAIYQGFSLDLISYEVTRTTLLGNMMTWLLNALDVEEDLSNMNNANISIYPNPAVANFKVSFESNKSVNSGMVYIANSNGQNIQTISNTVNTGKNEFSVATVGLPSGNYYVITSINGIMSYQPFVITK